MAEAPMLSVMTARRPAWSSGDTASATNSTETRTKLNSPTWLSPTASWAGRSRPANLASR